MQVENWVTWFCGVIGVNDPVAISFATGSVAVMALLLAATIGLAAVGVAIRWIFGT